MDPSALGVQTTGSLLTLTGETTGHPLSSTSLGAIMPIPVPTEFHSINNFGITADERTIEKVASKATCACFILLTAVSTSRKAGQTSDGTTTSGQIPM
jgi:hypothetical protein